MSDFLSRFQNRISVIGRTGEAERVQAPPTSSSPNGFKPAASPARSVTRKITTGPPERLHSSNGVPRTHSRGGSGSLEPLKWDRVLSHQPPSNNGADPSAVAIDEAPSSPGPNDPNSFFDAPPVSNDNSRTIYVTHPEPQYAEAQAFQEIDASAHNEVSDGRAGSGLSAIMQQRKAALRGSGSPTLSIPSEQSPFQLDAQKQQWDTPDERDEPSSGEETEAIAARYANPQPQDFDRLTVQYPADSMGQSPSDNASAGEDEAEAEVEDGPELAIHISEAPTPPNRRKQSVPNQFTSNNNGVNGNNYTNNDNSIPSPIQPVIKSRPSVSFAAASFAPQNPRAVGRSTSPEIEVIRRATPVNPNHAGNGGDGEEEEEEEEQREMMMDGQNVTVNDNNANRERHIPSSGKESRLSQASVTNQGRMFVNQSAYALLFDDDVAPPRISMGESESPQTIKPQQSSSPSNDAAKRAARRASGLVASLTPAEPPVSPPHGEPAKRRVRDNPVTKMGPNAVDSEVPPVPAHHPAPAERKRIPRTGYYARRFGEDPVPVEPAIQPDRQQQQQPPVSKPPAVSLPVGEAPPPMLSPFSQLANDIRGSTPIRTQPIQTPLSNGNPNSFQMNGSGPSPQSFGHMSQAQYPASNSRQNAYGHAPIPQPYNYQPSFSSNPYEPPLYSHVPTSLSNSGQPMYQQQQQQQLQQAPTPPMYSHMNHFAPQMPPQVQAYYSVQNPVEMQMARGGYPYGPAPAYPPNPNGRAQLFPGQYPPAPNMPNPNSFSGRNGMHSGERQSNLQLPPINNSPPQRSQGQQRRLHPQSEKSREFDRSDFNGPAPNQRPPVAKGLSPSAAARHHVKSQSVPPEAVMRQLQHQNAIEVDSLSVGSSVERKQGYKPYTLKDFKKLAVPEMGSLGPAVETEEMREKKKRLEQIRKFSHQIRVENAKRLLESQSSRNHRSNSLDSSGSSGGGGGGESEALGTKALSSREKALKFAAAIPKPLAKEKERKMAVSSAPMVRSGSVERDILDTLANSAAGGSVRKLSGAEHLPRLSELTDAHNQTKASVDAIRRQFAKV